MDKIGITMGFQPSFFKLPLFVKLFLAIFAGAQCWYFAKANNSIDIAMHQYKNEHESTV